MPTDVQGSIEALIGEKIAAAPRPTATDVAGLAEFVDQRIAQAPPQPVQARDVVGLVELIDQRIIDSGLPPPPPPLPTLSIADAEAVESGGSAFFEVALSAPSDQVVTVDWQTVDDTAVAGIDYVAGSGTITFQPGDRAASIGVEIIADEVAETNERFIVQLSNPVNATLGDSVASGLIVDDDVIIDPPPDPGDIPADALDRAAFGSTRAWIDAMNAQGRPGKVGSGVWDAPPRTVLRQSIHGYGSQKPVFRGPAASFLYIHAPNVLITNVRFEDVQVPVISADETEALDWGDNLRPRSGYGYGSSEYSQLHYDADLVNFRVTRCEFARCGICVLFIRHFRVHDGVVFSDNVVEDGMAGVTILGYRFQQVFFERNRFRRMVGSRFAVSSQNHTETLLMLGGINVLNAGHMAASNGIFVRGNDGLGYTSSHPQNNKNAAVFMDVRGGSGIIVEDNRVEDFYNTAGSNDCNAVYLKSRGGIRFRRNTWINCGARPSSTAFGSEAAYYAWKGGSDDIISEDDTFIGGPQAGNAPMISCGTASNVRFVRPTFRGWRQEGPWGGSKGRPGVPCMIHHWSGANVSVESPDIDDCSWGGGSPRAHFIAHRDKASGVSNHRDWRANFNGNQTDLVYKGSGTAVINLTNCQTADGNAVTIRTGAA